MKLIAILLLLPLLANATPVAIKCENNDTYALDEATGTVVITSGGKLFKEVGTFTPNMVYMKDGFALDRTTLVLSLSSDGKVITRRCSLLDVTTRKF
jgi:hypothetical protein